MKTIKIMIEDLGDDSKQVVATELHSNKMIGSWYVTKEGCSELVITITPDGVRSQVKT